MKISPVPYPQTCEDAGMILYREIPMFLPRFRDECEAVHGMINDGLIDVKPVFSEPDNDVLFRMQKYSFIPGSFADLCLVYLYETRKDCHILTLDRDFLHFRDRSGKHLKLVAPFDL